MTRIAPAKRRDFEKFLEYIGCGFKRQKGDHMVWDRAGLKRPVVYPKDREIPVFIIRNNLRTLGLSPEEYLEILKKI